MGKVFKDVPIAEITLRKFERPSNEDKKELIRKFCISVGLLQPGDSRDVIVDIINLLLDASKHHEFMTSKEIEDEIKKIRTKGVAPSNIRRQLLRLERTGFIERVNGRYRIREFMNLSDLIDEIRRFVVEPTLERIKEYAKRIDNI
ncbi:MAG: hypothetical protein J7K73_01770 [Nanoarchaeota archaeon]|nr:hypothetical protein [Nanoarchaeota archaeon]